VLAMVRPAGRALPTRPPLGKKMMKIARVSFHTISLHVRVAVRVIYMNVASHSASRPESVRYMSWEVERWNGLSNVDFGVGAPLCEESIPTRVCVACRIARPPQVYEVRPTSNRVE
jgi:hypothetical protein